MNNFINKTSLKLCLVIGQHDCLHYDIFTTIKLAIQGGVTSIQLREKNITESELIELATQIRYLLPEKIPLIINDYVDVAAYLKLPVHIGQHDLVYTLTRKKMGPHGIIGLSVSNVEQAEQSKILDVDYYGIGPVFTTQSKVDAGKETGINALNHISTILKHKPCIAIGGINPQNIKQLRTSFIDGVAVISAIASSTAPTQAAEDLLI